MLLNDRTLIVSCIGDGKLSGDVNAGAVPWWSITKTCMAAAVLILSERGKLLLDAPLPGRPFSLRQFLRHDAGLRDYTAVPDYLAAATSVGAPWSEVELPRTGRRRQAGVSARRRLDLFERRLSCWCAAPSSPRSAPISKPRCRRWCWRRSASAFHIAREPGDISRARSAIRAITIPAGSITAC